VKCECCQHPPDDDDPIFRATVAYFGIWYERFRGSIGFVCEKCKEQHFAFAWREWRPAEPCYHCRRPVTLVGHRCRPACVVCGRECWSAAYLAAATDRRHRWSLIRRKGRRHQRRALRPQARRCRALLARMQTEGLSAEASGMTDRLTLGSEIRD
jgi:hypothetical protein